jgi:hypothetical protein
MITAQEAREYANGTPSDIETFEIDQAIREAAADGQTYLMWDKKISLRVANYLRKKGYTIETKTMALNVINWKL